MLLDVGCGNAELAKGDVNVDLFREGRNLQIGNQKVGERVNPHKIKNFVVADACHLPFKAGAFKVVFSSHTIEHVSNPFACILRCAVWLKGGLLFVILIGVGVMLNGLFMLIFWMKTGLVNQLGL